MIDLDKELRELEDRAVALGLTMAQVAAIARVHPKTWETWRKHQAIPSLRPLLAIQDALDKKERAYARRAL